MITPVHVCQCRGDELPGPNGTFYCQAHQCRKTQHYLQLCREHEGYRRLWNDGHGPGQDPPKEAAALSTAADPPGPGAMLRKLLGCGSGFRHFRELDEWGPDGCLVHLEEIVSMLIKNSCKNKDGLTERSARRLVQLVVERARRNEANLATGIDG